MYYNSSSLIKSIKSIYLNYYSLLDDSIKESVIIDESIKRKNPIIVYSDQMELQIHLGYICLKKCNMTLSPLYEALRYNTVSFGMEDKTNDLKQIDCYKIEDWRFDIVLKGKEVLEMIFYLIATLLSKKDKIVILWREKNSELDYYPIFEKGGTNTINSSFVAHFVESFYDEETCH